MLRLGPENPRALGNLGQRQGSSPGLGSKASGREAGCGLNPEMMAFLVSVAGLDAVEFGRWTAE